MKTMIKRVVKNYLKMPLFWIGVLLMLAGVFMNLRPYLSIRYVSSEDEPKEFAQENPIFVDDGEVQDGYVPSSSVEQRRKIWEEMICGDLVSVFQMNQDEIDAVINAMKDMEISEACEYLKKEHHFNGAIDMYEHTKFHQGTKEEINSYLESKLQENRFSFYFSRKFADFAGVFMALFSTVMLAALFWQDTRKNNYELLHTRPISARKYVLGKIAGGFCVCLIVLIILNLALWAVCYLCTRSDGFEVKLFDFAAQPVFISCQTC